MDESDIGGEPAAALPHRGNRGGAHVSLGTAPARRTQQSTSAQDADSHGRIPVPVLATSLGSYVRDWGTAIGTVGATAVAASVVVRGRLKQPKLTLSFISPAHPDVLPVPEHAPGDGRTTLIAYVYLSVTNARRRVAATDVEVLLKEVEIVDQPRDGAAPAPFGLGDMALKWSNSPDATRAVVPPGATRRLDFLRIENGRGTKGKLPAIVETRPEPSNERHHLPPAKVRFELMVTASNSDAKQYTVMVDWDGSFPTDDPTRAGVLWKHLSVGRPQPF